MLNSNNKLCAIAQPREPAACLGGKNPLGKTGEIVDIYRILLCTHTRPQQGLKNFFLPFLIKRQIMLIVLNISSKYNYKLPKSVMLV
jgi:hypothetical protein